MKKFLKLVAPLFIVFGLLGGTANAAEIKVAAIEWAPKSPGFESNLQGIVEAISVAAKNGARLMVLPEESMQGFNYTDVKNILPYADTIPGKATSELSKVAKKYNVYVVAGLYEKEPSTGKLYNSAVLVGPKGYVGKYRKNNLAPGEGNTITAGTIGFPVFDTDIGKIGIVICYDDTNIQNLLLPVLRGADIVAHPVGSYKIPSFTTASYTNHSTMANISTAVTWLGTNWVATNLSGTEGPSAAGVAAFDGASSIWDSNGKRLVSAPLSYWTNPTKPQTVYATINVGKKSDQKTFWLKNRRPELYTDVNNYRYPDYSPSDFTSRQISSLLVQYEPKTGNIEENYKKIDELVKNHPGVFNLTVLPFNSFLGPVKLNKENIAKYAEELNGRSYQLASDMAKKYKTYVLFSMPEKSGNQFYETAILFDFNGKQTGIYRKSHLNDSEKTWATAGNDLPVFRTVDFGNVAIMLDDEVRIPELTQMYSIYRADLILVPVMYNQKEYGSSVDIPRGVVSDASNRGMAMWYNIPKYSQAYTLVANYIHGEHGDIGGSALYSPAPEANYYPPNIAPNKESAYLIDFTTHSNSTVYMNQDRLIATRRWDLAAPLALDTGSACFREWQKDSNNNDLCPKTISGK